ncbi:hypothetical protein HB843_03175 [Listeria seeligeri]|nr:hypothetical protein [Listeria seeligeri]MBC1479739.1 hypothetical protein [Listeria seeligeri]MBC1719774.1 hypothetical protein [Listeria seeligeri]MBC1790639.1 hypothetical protein [Listeria seeligeri]MBC1857145.1 hypothetical protein [Listeria seeligeri]
MLNVRKLSGNRKEVSKVIEKNIFTLENPDQVKVAYNDDMTDDSLKKFITDTNQPVNIFLELGIFDKEDMYSKFPKSEFEEMTFKGIRILLIKNIQLDDILVDEAISIFRLLANSNFQVYIISGHSLNMIVSYSHKSKSFIKKDKIDKIELNLGKNQLMVMSDYDGSAVIILYNNM